MKSGQDFPYDTGIRHARVGECLVIAVMRIRQFVVIHPQLVQQRRVQVGNRHAVDDRAIAHLVGGPINLTGPESSPRQNGTEGISIMIAPQPILRNRQTAKFAGPDDNC